MGKERLFVTTPDDWASFATQLGEETDRGAILVGATFLDRLLGALLEARILDDRKISKKLLKGDQAPCSSFYSRILLSYSLGLISEDEYHDLEIIREIRNTFAHQLVALKFSETLIESQIRKLQIPKRVPESIFVAENLTARQVLIDTIAMLSTFLEKRRTKTETHAVPARRFFIELSDKPG